MKSHMRLYRKRGSSHKEFSSENETSKKNDANSLSVVFNRAMLRGEHFNEASERQADTIADRIMNMESSKLISFSSAKDGIHRKCAQCEEDENELQKKDNGVGSASITTPFVNSVLNSSGGRSLDTETRSFMESRFSYDFSNVRIHDNKVAAKSADSINASAYTSGNNIVFNSGRYNPGSDAGKKLLAHELTHVVQQNESSSNATERMGIIQRQPSQANDPCSTDKIWGMWDAMKETLCSMKCDLPFTGEDCQKECTEKYGFWSKLKKCRQEHPFPPTPDPWDETE